MAAATRCPSLSAATVSCRLATPLPSSVSQQYYNRVELPRPSPAACLERRYSLRGGGPHTAFVSHLLLLMPHHWGHQCLPHSHCWGHCSFSPEGLITSSSGRALEGPRRRLTFPPRNCQRLGRRHRHHFPCLPPHFREGFSHSQPEFPPSAVWAACLPFLTSHHHWLLSVLPETEGTAWVIGLGCPFFLPSSPFSARHWIEFCLHHGDKLFSFSLNYHRRGSFALLLLSGAVLPSAF